MDKETTFQVARLLLDFEALNRKRELADALQELGVTQEDMLKFTPMARSMITAPILNDMVNLLGHIEKGIETNDDKLWKSSKRKRMDQACKLAEEFAPDANSDSPGMG